MNEFTKREAPSTAAAPHEQVEALRSVIADNENRLSDATGNVAMADMEIADMESKLAGWRKWRAYQAKRREVFIGRIRADREQLRMEEDFASGVDAI